MATVLLFPDCRIASPVARTKVRDATAEIVILPCIRREPLAGGTRIDFVAEQMLA